jgi:hypothetical protein
MHRKAASHPETCASIDRLTLHRCSPVTGETLAIVESSIERFKVCNRRVLDSVLYADGCEYA